MSNISLFTLASKQLLHIIIAIIVHNKSILSLNPMHEVEIKLALEKYLLSFSNSKQERAFLHELRLCDGAARADLVDTSTMHCYEIKSEKDSLKRLVSQGARYMRVFDRITLVTAPRHLSEALTLLPSWWGITLVDGEKHQPFQLYRRAKPNKNLVPEQLAKVLTRDECLSILTRKQLNQGSTKESLYKLQGTIAKSLSLISLKQYVKEALADRGHYTIV